jgi:hypothetical protein
VARRLRGDGHHAVTGQPDRARELPEP